MQILSVRLKNVKAHREAEFSFSPGINVLCGPNGAGKSTLFEAVGYALFGVDARDIVGRAERFVTLGEKRGEVAVTFRTAAGELWRVSRTVGAGARWLLARERDGEFEVEEHAGANETEERLRELLGLDRSRPLAEQFRQVIGPLQNDFLGPFVLKGTRRQEAFDQILGVDGWRRTFEGTRDLQRALEQKIETLEAEIAARREQAAALPERKAERTGIVRAAGERAKALAAQDASLREIEKELSALESRRAAIEKGAGELKVLRERIETGRQRIAEQKGRVEEARRSLEIVEGSRPGREAYEAAEARLKELRGREARLRETEKAVASLEKDYLRLTQQEEHEREEIASLRRQLRSEGERLAELEEEVRPSAQLRELAASLARAQAALDACRSRRAQLAGRRESLREGRDKLATGRCPFFQEECRNLDPGAADPFAGRLSELEKEMARLDEEGAALEKELEAARKAEKEIAVLAARAGELGRRREALAEREKALDARERKCGELGPLLAAAREGLGAKRKELEPFAGLEGEIAAAEKERARHQEARDLFQAHGAVAADLDARRETLARYEDFLAELAKDCAEREERLKELQGAYRPQEHEAARRRRDALMAAVAALGQELKGLGEQAERLDREIAALERVVAEIEARQGQMRGFKEKEEMVRYLRGHVFRHVSARLSERFREAVSRRADRIYRTVAETDEELEWGEGYQIVLRDLREGSVRERTDDQLSGGQVMSAVVALRLALLQTLGARVAFFDEPTSNLDAARRENLARAFRAIDTGREEVAEHWYDQLFLVSHDVAFSEITDQVVEL